MDLISVIVSIYNVEKYLEKCLESLINQTFGNLEIILVNDGSQDSSLSICQKFALNDCRIRILNIENGGLSNARNTGLEKCQGKYILFVDGDDFLELNAIEEMYCNIIRKKSDICICKIYKTYNEENICYESFFSEHSIDSYYAMELFCKDQIPSSVCNKLIDRKLFLKNRFPLTPCGAEDTYVTYYLFKEAEKVCFVDKYLYHYVQRSDSIVHTISFENKNNLVSIYKFLKTEVETSYPCFKVYWNYKFLNQLYAIIIEFFLYGEKKDMLYFKARYNEIFDESICTYDFKKIAMRYFFYPYCWFIKIKKSLRAML